MMMTQWGPQPPAIMQYPAPAAPAAPENRTSALLAERRTLQNIQGGDEFECQMAQKRVGGRVDDSSTARVERYS